MLKILSILKHGVVHLDGAHGCSHHNGPDIFSHSAAHYSDPHCIANDCGTHFAADCCSVDECTDHSSFGITHFCANTVPVAVSND